MKARLTAICLTLFLLGSSVPAWAVPITFAFSGTITEVKDLQKILDGSIAVGTPFSGYYRFESTMIDRDPSLEYGVYVSPAVPGPTYSLPADPTLIMSVQLGDYAITAPFERVWLTNAIADWYTARCDFCEAFGLVAAMGITLIDDDGGMLANDQLPLTPPSLNSSDVRWFGIGNGGDAGATLSVGGTLDSLVLVPEPSVLVLILLAFANASVRRRT